MKNNYVGTYRIMDIMLSIMKRELHGSQCCDIIAIKNNIATLIECKNLENKSGIFNLNRIEANQIQAYKRLKLTNNSNMIIAILWNDNVYFVNFDLLQFFDKSIDLKKLEPNEKGWENLCRGK